MPPCPSFFRDVAESPGDGDLLLVGDVQAAKEDDSTLLQGVANVLGFDAAEQRVEIGSDLATDPRGDVDDF